MKNPAPARPMNPGDEARPGTPATGKVVRGIGGA